MLVCAVAVCRLRGANAACEKWCDLYDSSAKGIPFLLVDELEHGIDLCLHFRPRLDPKDRLPKIHQRVKLPLQIPECHVVLRDLVMLVERSPQQELDRIDNIQSSDVEVDNGGCRYDILVCGEVRYVVGLWDAKESERARIESDVGPEPECVFRVELFAFDVAGSVDTTYDIVVPDGGVYHAGLSHVVGVHLCEC